MSSDRSSLIIGFLQFSQYTSDDGQPLTLISQLLDYVSVHVQFDLERHLDHSSSNSSVPEIIVCVKQFKKSMKLCIILWQPEVPGSFPFTFVPCLS